MHLSNRSVLRLAFAKMLAVTLISSGGCQTWRSSSAVPGLTSKQGEREILREAKHDPFPSPTEVGMKASK